MTRKTRPDEQESVLSQLQERVKELSCLYTVSQIIVEADLSRNDRLQKIVSTLPRAWQFSDRAAARITLDDEKFESPGYDRVRNTQQADLVVNGARRGAVEIGYASKLLADGEDLFLPDELSLLENVARQISLFITREEDATRRRALEEQLLHTDRLATIGQLAAGVAHEINEPLSSILGFAQLAMKVPAVPQKAADDLREIVKSSLHAREIVKKLLLFARQTTPKMARVNLNEIVEDALFLLEAGNERQGTQLIRQLAPKLPMVEADPVQLRQVLVNLTVNAMQSIAMKGVVTVETRIEGKEVVLSVSDNGSGMTPDVLSRVFHPFFTTKEIGEGTGLGLSVVHGIVISHGGTIEALSREGEGSRFIVRLPAALDGGVSCED